MKKDVIIKIVGHQSFDETSGDEVEFVTSGFMSKKKGVYTISYEESKLTGMEGTTTTLNIEQQRITLLRHGGVSSHMVFEKGKKHVSYYDTGFGAMTIGVSAHMVKADMHDNGGDIEVGYSIDVDNTLAGENTFKISIREAGVS